MKWILTAFVFLWLPPSLVDANARTVGLEYGTYPLVGFFLASEEADSLGWYFGLKISLPVVEDKNVYKFNRTYAENVLRDAYLGDLRSLVYVNLGRTIRIYEKLHGFLALGAGGQTRYRKYNDRFGILGNRGDYYIEDGTSVIVNAEIGTFLMFESFSLKLSYDTASRSPSFGVGYTF